MQQPTCWGCERHEDCQMSFCIDGMCRNVQCADDTHCQKVLTATMSVCQGLRIVRTMTATVLALVPTVVSRTDDNDPNVNPNVIEDGQQRCNGGIDNNCDGMAVMCPA